jgi:hypothetical protein
LGVEPKRFPALDITEALESLPILDVGTCEPLKAVIHSAALGLCALMGLYNAAAWLKRRQTHLAVNAVIYLAATYWEQRHVAQHIVRCVPSEKPAQAEIEAPEPVTSAAA